MKLVCNAGLFLLFFLVFGTLKSVNVMLIEYIDEQHCSNSANVIMTGGKPMGQYHNQLLSCEG
jgi:hypothetical protein